MSIWQADSETIARDKALKKALPAPGRPATFWERFDRAITARFEHLAKHDPNHFLELVRYYREK